MDRWTGPLIDRLFSFGLAVALALVGTRGVAQTPRLSMTPSRPAGGTLTRLTIDRIDGHADSVVSVVGEMAGEPLHFLDAGKGGDKLQALGAIPVEVSDSVVANVVIARASGKSDTLRLKLPYPHQAPPPPMGSRGRAPGARRLRVDPRFTAEEFRLFRRVKKDAQILFEITSRRKVDEAIVAVVKTAEVIVEQPGKTAGFVPRDILLHRAQGFGGHHQ